MKLSTVIAKFLFMECELTIYVQRIRFKYVEPDLPDGYCRNCGAPVRPRDEDYGEWCDSGFCGGCCLAGG